MRTGSVSKAGQTYLFRYAPGQECAMLASLAELAQDPASGLDWLDVATLSFQVTSCQAKDCIDAIAPALEE